MRKAPLTLAVVASAYALAACKPSAEAKQETANKAGSDTNLECAALISAASYLIAGGQAESDPDFNRRPLFTLMAYLNSYAIPKGLKESEAFDKLHARRAALTEALSVEEIMDRARRCIDSSPL